MPTTYRVWCRVSGGVTGTRESRLHANGEPVTFPTLAAAEAEAARLNQRMNHAYSVADFHYVAKEITTT